MRLTPHVYGIRDARGRVLAWTIVVAIVLHLPLTPIPWLASWLWPYLGREDSWDYEDDSIAIPVSLLAPSEEEPSLAATPLAAAAPPSTPNEEMDHRPRGSTASSASQKPPRPPVRDAGAPSRDAMPPDDAGPTIREAGAPRDTGTDGLPGSDAELRAAAGLSGDSATPATEGGRPGANDGGTVSADAAVDAAAVRGSRPSVQDTLSLAGGLAKTVKGKPNVAIAVWFSTIRDQPLGRLTSEVFSCIPQWRDFLGTEVDAVEDLDGVLLFGPRMADSSKVTMIVQSRMQMPKIKKVLEGLVRSSPPSGGWVDAGSSGIVARFRADRADRVAFTHPQDLVIVTPPEGYEQLRSVREPLSLPASRGRAISVTMVTPWRPARARGIAVPDTLSEARLDVLASNDGGIDLKLELDDKDAPSAEEHAQSLTRDVEQLFSLYGGLVGMFVQPPTLVAQDRRIVAQLHLPSLAATILLGSVRGQFCGHPLDAGIRPR